MNPRYPLEGVASWNMNTLCNYRCTYCTQRFLDNRKAWARDLPGFLSTFARLSGDWEIKLSGGEPFLHPDFLETVRALADAGRRVSVVTNFSASHVQLQAYAETTARKPGVFSASFHREWVEEDAFLEKLGWFKTLHRGPLVATCVATERNLPDLLELQNRFQKAGLTLRVQPEKQDRRVVAYGETQREILKELGGHNGTGLVTPGFQGRACWAGSRYFIVDHQGEAWRCYPARKERQEYLGNFLDGSFRLGREPSVCRYEFCTCSIPAQRGMVTGGIDVCR